MSVIYVERGGLLVPERAADADVVRRELKRLDPSLILSRDWDARHKRVVWQVRHVLGSGQAPLLVFEWRQQNGTGEPLPLSSGFVEAFKRQEARGRELFQAARERTEARKQAAMRSFDEQLAEYAKDMGRAGAETRSACFHRGQHLRRSRVKRGR